MTSGHGAQPPDGAVPCRFLTHAPDGAARCALSDGPPVPDVARAFGAAVCLLHEVADSPVVCNVDGTVVVLLDRRLWWELDHLRSRA